MSWGTLAPVTRAGTGIALVGLLILGVRGDAASDELTVVTGATSPEALAANLASDASGAIVYRDSVPPTRRIVGLLASGAGHGRSVALDVPAEAPRLSVRAPFDPVAQRRTALHVTVRGEAGEAVLLRIEDEAGQADTVTVAVGASGSTTARVAVEPARSGLERWTVRAGGEAAPGATATARATATAAAWVRPAEPLRVLVLTGAPGWETRYLVRALESSRIDVTVRQDLGRGLVVSSASGATPTTPDELAMFDVVVASTGQESAVLTALDRWMQGDGGGVLLLEGDASEAVPGDAPGQVGELTWSGPAELLPLPALGLDVSGTPIAISPGAGDVTVAELDDGQVLVAAATRGRGRLLRSGLATWPWVLAGGAEAAHTDWWTSAVEWLAGGLTRDALLNGPTAQPFTVWEGRIEGRVPASLVVQSDEGTQAVEVIDAAAGRGVVRLVPTVVGAHLFSASDEAAFGATIVEDGSERLSWAAAALEVGGSGGATVPAPGAGASTGRPLDPGRDRAWPLFLLLAAAMGAGWTASRIKGMS